MYGLQPTDLLKSLVAQELNQVCFGPHDLILNFDNKVSILVWSSIEVRCRDGAVLKSSNYKEIAPLILTLLSRQVSSYEIADGGRTLMLRFTEDGELSIFDDSDQYESFMLRIDDKWIVA